MNAHTLKKHMLDYAEEHGLDALSDLYEAVEEEWHDGDSDTVDDEDKEEDDEDDSDELDMSREI